MAINKYFFTMDEIDLIPNKFGNFNDVVPLWSCGKDTQKYFEFEIRGSEEKSCAGIQTTSCYICDIEVPKMFLIEHRNSRKHLINKSVADTALSRISKDSIDDFSVVKNIDNTNNYFCPECVAVVNVEERHSHENQQSHKHSVLYNNMMEHFHSVYINEVDTSNSKFDSSICSESNNNTRHCEEILTSKSGVFPESSSPDGEIEYELERPSRSTGVVFCMEDDLIHCTVCNTKFDIHSYNVHKTGKRHIMNKVSNVHYMMREFGDDLQCITCKVTVENSFESVSAHCNGADHLASYCKALKENSVINRKGRLYCKICAKNIHKRNELIHIYQSFHQENYANYKQVDDKNDMTTDSGNKVVYICPICDVKVPNNIDNIKIHNDGRPHKSNLLFRDQKTDSQMEYIGDSAISDIDLQEQDKKSSMEDNDIIVKKKRTRGRRNKKNITKALPNDLTSCTTNSSKTALIEVGDSVVETSIPETEVTLNVKSSILTPELLNYEDTQKVYDVHPKLSTATLESANSIQEPLIQSSGSKIVIPEYLNVKKELLTPISQFSNQVPLNPSAESLNLSSELVSLNPVANSIYEPLIPATTSANQTPEHTLNETLKSTNLIQGACLPILDSNQNSKLAIVTPGPSNDSNVGLSQKTNPINSKPTAKDLADNPLNLINYLVQSKPDYLKVFQSLLHSTDTTIETADSIKTEYICFICKMKVPNHDSNIKQHNEGKTHQKNYMELLTKNNIEKYNSNYYCKLCNITFDNLSTHLKKREHMVKFKNKQCNAKKACDKTKTAKAKVLPYIKVANGNDLYCQACCCHFPNTTNNLKSHTQGFRHQEAIKIFTNC